MPQTDIMNPTPTHPLNPDYSFQKKRPLTHLNAKANRGVPFFRDITDVGHQFILSWADKSLNEQAALKRYYEQYRGGFFTFIDHEGGGRHYVGRFSTPVEPIPVQHNHWAVQQVTFDEIPGAPMLVYPHHWDRDAIWELLLDDWGDIMVATSGAWTLTENAVAASGWEYVDPNAGAGDTATYQYYGYGFQIWARNGPNMGVAQVSLDGTVLGNVDFYAPAAAAQAQDLYTATNVPLGIHLVQMITTGGKNSASTANTIVWDALKVMR